jgi:hypothetical protein
MRRGRCGCEFRRRFAAGTTAVRTRDGFRALGRCRNSQAGGPRYEEDAGIRGFFLQIRDNSHSSGVKVSRNPTALAMRGSSPAHAMGFGSRRPAVEGADGARTRVSL